jgi:adenosylhomocysteine nucleosidase
MKFGVLAPMPSELRPVVKVFGLDKDSLEGEVGPHQVRAAKTGIGIELATQAANKMVDRGDVDHVVVVGIAGGLGPTSPVGALVIPEAVEDFPDALSFAPAPLGGLTNEGIIVSSDEYGYEPEVVEAFLARGVVAVDMETVAVAKVCQQKGIPWSAVRAISDPADGPTVNTDVIGLVKPDGTPDTGKAIRYLLRHPTKFPAMAKMGRDATAAASQAAKVAKDAIAEHEG